MLDLVTGSSGLLGSCLVEQLLARGRRVRALDLVPPPDARGAAPGVEFVQADLRDARAVTDACRGAEVVYHLAAAQRMKPQFAGLSEAAFCAGGFWASGFWASLGPGSISQAAHPAIAIAGSTRSRALDPWNDDQTPAAIAMLSVLGAAPIGCAT